MEDLKSLIAKRVQARRAMARHRKYIVELARDKIDVYVLRERRNKLAQLWDNFNSVQAQIEILKEKEAENEKVRNEFEEEYFELMAKTNELLEESESGEKLVSKNTLVVKNLEKVKLPPIELKSFSGKFDEWIPFYQIFKSMIHENKDLGEIQKLHYLRSALVGNAAEVISDLELTPENYSEAWNLLLERYDNRRLIIQKHVRAILETPVVPKENPVLLRGFIDQFKKHFRALKALKSDAVGSSDLLIYFILSKLDMTIVRQWEDVQSRDSRPNIHELVEFLTHKCETLEVTKRSVGVNQQTPPSRKIQAANVSTSASNLKCPVCSEKHYVAQCDKFKSLSPNEKFRKILNKGICINCLRVGSHLAKNCFSLGCKICKEKHHELLHDKFVPENPQAVTTASFAAKSKENDQIVLSTVKLQIFGADGRKHNCRALLDCGSQSDFITDKLANKLGLQRYKLNVDVIGIGKKSTKTFERVDVKIKSRLNDYGLTLKPLILDKITETLPIQTFDKRLIQIPRRVILADPEFNVSNEVELLIGAHNFWGCINEKSIQLKGQPRLQDTKFGWIVAGGWNSKPEQYKCSVSNVASINEQTNLDLTKFWEIEDVSNPCEFTVEEKYCVNHFEKTYKRDNEGRFIVELPIKQEKISLLGDNKEIALKRFYNLETKLNRNLPLKEEYVKFMREYESLGHMVEIKENLNTDSKWPNYYIPHHCVLNENSLTTKLRVVFDASAKDKGGVSLNEILMIGPVIQQDLFSLLMRFRTFKFVLMADIRKMYRQIRVAERQTELQKIFWRESSDSKLKVYKLLTVTYGTSSASFLAIKTLQELAKLESTEYPLGAKIALRDFYVDDLITGASSKAELINIKNEITALLQRGGMELAKWCTNVPELVPEFDSKWEEGINFDDSSFRALGVKWWPISDEFGYTTQGLASFDKIITKRNILSTVARIFDPLGLVGPYIVTAKILLQKLWELKLGWDEEVPEDVIYKWKKCLSNLLNLQNIKIPRAVMSHNWSKMEIHGFCDACEEAYGACIYVRSFDNKGKCYSQLLCSKSRVSPIKSISLPRLELCAAVLLTKLIQKVKVSLEISFEKIFCWSDSKIVLAWLSSSSKRWSVFVAHRVGLIQDNIPAESWNHVPSEENPADIISRGFVNAALESVQLWWQGPEWLYNEQKSMPEKITKLKDEELPEMKRVTNVITKIEPVSTRNKCELWNRYGSYKRLVRIVAYIKRFIENCKCKKEERWKFCLSSEDYERAEMTLIKLVQAEEYSEEIKLLQKGISVTKKSKLINLNPFLDEDQIIRVGGRLQNSDLPFIQKHPIILPGQHTFTRLLLIHEHERLLHTGAQTTLAAIREKYWPVAVKNYLKALIRNCVTCRKASPIVARPIMGNLPKPRTEFSRPFETSGVDYCGPFLIKEAKRKNSKTMKIWVVVFVCFAVKALHFEIATDLTAEGFVNALKRFIARRGIVKSIFSDNATNFSAASKELTSIEWTFIPPRAPHFGGLWEAAVKAFKTHFKRIIGQQILTYEEFNTIIISIEAILNSRPLTPLSDDVNDFSCLTPAHFLVGDSLLTIPTSEKRVTYIKIKERWELVQRIKDLFWKRWHAEYLRSCQTRAKWATGGEDPKVGQMVMVLEDNVFGVGTIGRITKIYRGSDGVVRVVVVRTPTGEFKRPVKKVAPLPIPYDESHTSED